MNNYLDFIKTVYGEEYMSIPRKIHEHGRHKPLLYIENIDEIMEDSIKELREFNSSI